MGEQQNLKRQFILHIIYNMIAFSSIFIIFGILMFLMVRNITFSSIDNQLKDAQNKFVDMNEKLEILYDIFGLENYTVFDNNVSFDYNFSQRIDNPQVNCIVRDKNEKILNKEDLGKISEYESDLGFDKNKLNTVYGLKINNKYHYRCLNFLIKSADSSKERYVQLLINVDGETSLIYNYKNIIVQAVMMGIILSGIASLILSRKTLKPIQEILKKQTEFVQNVSHELRTPLTIIQAKQELLLREPNARIIDKSEEIMLTLNETKRLSKITKDLMILLRGSAPNKMLILQKEDVKIDEWIQNIAAPYQEIVLAQGKTLTLNLNFQKDISIDTNKIHQLLVILLDNSIKYTEKGDTIEIRTFLKDNKCNMEVIDTGIGISEEGLKHVFDRFYREDRARNRETGGSGLGLSIATTIVNIHNGTIRASHNSPKGTIFTVRLPR